MPATSRNFGKYLEKWERIFKEKRNVDWNGEKLENGYCGQCRLCCGPQGDDDPFPMALMPWQISPANKDEFYMLNANTACLGRLGCKSLGENGCDLPFEKRPVACGLFPIVLANGRLYLYKCCPAVLFTPLFKFVQVGCEAAEFLSKMELKDLRHLSLDLDDKILTEKYIDLDIKIF